MRARVKHKVTSKSRPRALGGRFVFTALLILLIGSFVLLVSSQEPKPEPSLVQDRAFGGDPSVLRGFITLPDGQRIYVVKRIQQSNYDLRYEDVSGREVSPAELRSLWITSRPQLSEKLARLAREQPEKIVEVSILLRPTDIYEIRDQLDQQFAPRFGAHQEALQEAGEGTGEWLAILEDINKAKADFDGKLTEELRQAAGPAQDEVASLVSRLGGVVTNRTAYPNSITASVRAGIFNALLESPSVDSISEVKVVKGQLNTSVQSIRAQTLWNAGILGSPFAVGVLDSGMDNGLNIQDSVFTATEGHPAFRGKRFVNHIQLGLSGAACLDPFDFLSSDDKDGHGTAVGGIIMSQGSNQCSNCQGVAKGLGLTFNLKVACRFLLVGDAWSIQDDARSAIEWSLDQSVGDTPEVFNYSYGEPAVEDYSPDDQLWDSLIEGRRILVTFPSGNDGTTEELDTPGTTYNGITVASVWDGDNPDRTSDLIPPTYSTRGPTLSGRKKPDVAAPGHSIMTPYFDWEPALTADYYTVYGTSAAAPHVAGSAILLWGAAQARVPAQQVHIAVKALLINSAEDREPAGWDREWGWGYIDLQQAAQDRSWLFSGALAPQGQPGDFMLYRGSTLTNPGKTTVVWEIHPNQPLNDIDIFAFDEANNDWLSAADCGAGGEASQSCSLLNNVEQVTVPGVSSVVVKVKAISSDFGSVGVEDFALAAPVGFQQVTNPSFFIVLDRTRAVSGQEFTFIVSVRNNGGVSAHNNTVTLSPLPSGFSLVQPTTLSQVIGGPIDPGGAGLAFWTIRAPTVGSVTDYTFGASNTSSSYFETFTSALHEIYVRVYLPTLTVYKVGTGNGRVTSSPAGIDCGPTCLSGFSNGTAVVLTPTPDASSVFGGWSGCDSVAGDLCTVTMDTDRSVSATFNTTLPPPDPIPPQTTITSASYGPDYASYTWTGSDNVTPTANLVYSYRLDPLEPNFSPWTSDTSKSYFGLINGTYTFYVKARDRAGNEDSTPDSDTFTISGSIDPSVERVSVDSNWVEANGPSEQPSVSADGRFVAFASSASNLTAVDTQGVKNIFLRDRQTGETFLVSASSAGVPANAGCSWPAISADGNLIAFHSSATNLVAESTYGLRNVFVYERPVGAITLVSRGFDGSPANSWSGFPSISADGRFVASYSEARNLIENDANGVGDVFMHDLQTGATTRVSVSSNGAESNGSGGIPVISADGRFVVFKSEATNLVDSDTNGFADIFVRDLQTRETTRENVSSTGTEANDVSFPVRPYAISADGWFVAFDSLADNLDQRDTNTAFDIFVRDRQTGQTELESVASDGTQGSGFRPMLSADGRFVAFVSFSNNLMPGMSGNNLNIFLRDRQTDLTTVVGLSESHTPHTTNLDHAMSADGRFIVFHSQASHLVPGDNNGVADVFVAATGLVGAPVTVTAQLADATVGTTYSRTLQAIGGTPPYTWAVVSGSLPAGLSLNSSTGEISGTPTAVGIFDFTVQVSDSANPSQTGTRALSITVISLPIVSSQSVTIAEETPITITLTGIDPENDPLTFSIVTDPTQGTLSPITPVSDTSAEVTYTPNTDFNGSDSFSFKVNDGALDSNPATVSITVNAVNDAPVAQDDAFNLEEDSTLDVAVAGVLANDIDVDGDSLTAILASGPTDGSLTLNSDGSFSYVPSPDFNGTDSFTYKANDGTIDSNTATVSITVTPVNDVPVADAQSVTTDEDIPATITLAGTDIDGDSLTFAVETGPSNGTLSGINQLTATSAEVDYTPNSDFNGTDSFTLTVTDPGGLTSAPTTVSISVTPVNDAPVANAGADQTVAGTSDSGASVTLDGSASSDFENDPLTYTWTGPFPEGGGAVTGLNPTVTLNFGTSTITLVVNDGQGDSAPDTLDITITDFTVGSSPSSGTVSRGQSASYTVTVSPQFGSFDPSVSLACSNLPSLSSCSFSPATLTPGGSDATSTLTVSTTAPSAFLTPPFGPRDDAPLYALWLARLGGLGLPGLALVGVFLVGQESKKRKLRSYLSLSLLLALLVLQVACGGGGATTSSQPPPRPGTPTGTFNITITGTSGSLQHSTTATLVVQ